MRLTDGGVWYEQVEPRFVLLSLHEESLHPDPGRRARALRAQDALLAAWSDDPPDPAREATVLLAVFLDLLPQLTSILRLSVIGQTLRLAIEQGGDLGPHVAALEALAASEDGARRREVARRLLDAWRRKAPRRRTERAE